LRDVVGGGGVGDLAVGGGVDEIDVGLDQQGEGCGVARGCETPKGGLDLCGRHLRALWPTDLPGGHNSGKVVANSKGLRAKAAANGIDARKSVCERSRFDGTMGSAPAPWIQHRPTPILQCPVTPTRRWAGGCC
jgi:hypothetical protein